jgi:hypothetical protein
MFYQSTSIAVLIAEAKQPLVQVGGKSINDLREDFYDNAFNSVARNRSDVVSIYDIALSGGEPYAVWY